MQIEEFNAIDDGAARRRRARLRRHRRAGSSAVVAGRPVRRPARPARRSPTSRRADWTDAEVERGAGRPPAHRRAAPGRRHQRRDVARASRPASTRATPTSRRRLAEGNRRYEETLRPDLPGPRRRPQRRGDPGAARGAARQRPGTELAVTAGQLARDRRAPAAGLIVVDRMTHPVAPTSSTPPWAARPPASPSTLLDADGRRARRRRRPTTTAGSASTSSSRPAATGLVFATGPWFAAADRDTFFPEVDRRFVVEPGAGALPRGRCC